MSRTGALTRRDLVKAACATAAAAMMPASVRSQRTPKKRPNVLFLMSDQHKRSCMGAYGDAVAKTPNLDALAAKSVRFTQVYCADPVCTPSRASLLTGLYSHNHEAQNNARAYSVRHKTMAHHFGAAGYVTGLIGKMHWVDAQTHGFDYHLDFNDWFQYLGPRELLYANELQSGHGPGGNSGAGLPEIESLWDDEGNPWRSLRDTDDRKSGVHLGRVSKMEEKDHFESFVARESIRFLKNHKEEDGPFFLISSFLKPHDPFMPAERFARMFRAEDMVLPESWGKVDVSKRPKEVANAIKHNGPTEELGDPARAKEHIAFYYGNLAQMDDCVGQVLTALEETGHDRDTIIVYTSDHGEMLGALGLWQKFQFYEGSCGVPLLMHLPGGAAGVASTPLSQVNLSATLTDLCGVTQVQPNDSVSFAEVVRNPKSTRTYGPVYAEYALGSPHAKAMIREGDWKYTFWSHDMDELYNLKDDPEELRNLAVEAKFRPQAEKMKAALLAWHKPDDTPMKKA